MSTLKSEYGLSKHRFYELKHFCLQYSEWKRLYFSRVGFPENVFNPPTDTTSKDGISRADLSYRMHTVEETCMETNKLYSQVLFRIVTETSAAPKDPFLRELYYQFFKLLDKKRN